MSVYMGPWSLCGGPWSVYEFTGQYAGFLVSTYGSLAIRWSLVGMLVLGQCFWWL